MCILARPRVSDSDIYPYPYHYNNIIFAFVSVVLKLIEHSREHMS